jgi:hypothetical protein
MAVLRARACFLGPFVLAGLAATALLAGCGSDSKAAPTSTSRSGDLTIYAVESAGFSIGAPKSWEGIGAEMAGPALEDAARTYPKLKPLIDAMNKTGAGVKLIAADAKTVDGFNTNMNVVTEPIQSGTTVEEYTQANAEAIESVFGVTADETSATLPAGEAGLLTWASTEQGQTLRRVQYYFVDDESGYVLTYTTNTEEGSEYDAIFEQSAESFRLL